MKKILLGFAVLFAYSASAQQTISFEASEGYTTGTAQGKGAILGFYDLTTLPTEYETMSISNSRATNGTQSLEFESDLSGWDWLDGVVLPINSSGNFEVTFDIYLESDEDSDVVIAPLQLAAGDDEYTPVGEMRFSWFGTVRTVHGAGSPSGSTPYTPGQWYPAKITINAATSTITYFFNGTQLSTGAFSSTALTGQPIDKIGFLYDNYGSGFNVDNIVVTNSTASTADFVKNNFKIYPSPAADVLNLSAVSNSSINTISITDVNGRTVKQQQAGGVSSMQINVADLNAGVYFISVDAASGKGTTKFVKK